MTQASTDDLLAGFRQSLAESAEADPPQSTAALPAPQVNGSQGIVNLPRHIAGKFAGGFADVIADVPEAGGIVSQVIGTGTGENFFSVSDAIRENTRGLLPTDPEKEDEFIINTLSAGLGSFAAYMLAIKAGALAGQVAGARFGPKGAVVGGFVGGIGTGLVLGASSGIVETRRRMQQYVDSGQITESDANDISMLGALPGALEMAAPLRAIRVLGGKKLFLKAISHVRQSLARRVGGFAKEGVIEGVEEALQEAAGVVGQNAIERWLVNPNQPFFQGILIAAGSGGMVGAVAGFMVAAISGARRGKIKVTDGVTEIGAKVMIERAIQTGLINEIEAKQLKDEIPLLFRLSEARFSNREAEITETTDAEGVTKKKIKSRPDNVLWTERVALKHNPNLIKGLQAGRKKKGITLEDLFKRNAEGEPEFIFPFSRDSGFLQNPDKLTDDLRARQAIARIQSALLPNMRTIRGLKELSAGEQSVLLMRLDAEHAARISRVLRNDDNEGKSVGKEILREISEEVEPDDQSRVADILLASLESTIKGKPLSKQRDIIEGLIDTVSDPRARAVLQSLHRKMLTDFRRRPWSERVGMGRNKLNNLREAMRKKPQFVVDLLKRQKEMRGNLVELAKSLPPEHRGNLLKIISKVTTAREFGDAVDAIAKAQVIYQRAVHTKSIVKAAKRIEKNPRKAEAIALLRAGLDVRERDVVGARRRGTTSDVKAVRTDDGFDIIKGNTKLGLVKEVRSGVWTARTVGGIISEGNKSQRAAIDSILLPYMTVFHGGKLEGEGRAGPLLFVGTEKAARRAKGVKGKILKGRIELGNPIRMIDSGRVHTPTVIAEDIVDAGNDIPYLVDAIRNIENLHGVDVAGHALIAALQRQKYDGIIFTNINEDPGSESFVLFNTGKFKRDLGGTDVGAKTRQVVKAFVDDLGFYSQLEKTVLDKVSGLITFKQLIATLKKSGVKDAEIAWVGLQDLFSIDDIRIESFQPSKVKMNKGAILTFIQLNRLLLMETVRVKTPDKSDKTTQERTRILLETSIREKSIIFNIVSRMDSLSTIRPNTFDTLSDTIRLQMVTSRSAGQTFLEAIADVVSPGAATNVFIARTLDIEVNSLVANDILIRMDSELRSSVELSQIFEDNEQTNLTPLAAATEAVDRGTLEGFRIIQSLFTDLPSGELHEPSVHNMIHDFFLSSVQNEFRDYRAAVRETMIRIRSQTSEFLHELGIDSSEMQGIIREKLFASAELELWYERQQRFTREFDVVRDESSNIEPLFANYTLPGGTNYQEVILRFPDNVEQGIDTILSVPLGGGHFPENNVLAHIRMKDRVTEDGKKILFIEEIQSDLMQGIADRARSLVRRVAEGSPTESVSIGGREVPIPFVRNWHELVLRRVLRIAVEGGYDGVSWTTGREQTSRYGGAGEQGLNTFYDEVIPNYMRRLGKRFGAALDVLQVELGVPGVFHLQSGILITDSMRETLTSEGQKLFQRRRETLPTPAVAPVDGPSLTGPALIFDPDTGELVEANVRHRGEVTVDPDEALDRPLTDHEKEKVEIALKSSRFSAISPVHTDINKMWEKAVKEGSLTSRGLTILRFLFADSGPEVMGRLGDLISTGELVETTGKIETVPDRPIILLTTKRPSDATLDTLGFHTFLHEFGHLAYFAYLNESDIAGLKDDHSILLNTPSTKGHKSLAHEIIAEGTLEEATRRGRVLNAISESDVDYYASNPQEFFAQVFVQHILGNRIPLRALNSLTSRGVISRLINSLYWAMKRLIRIAKFTDSKIPKGTIAAIEKVFAGTEKSEGLSPERRKSEEFQRSVLIAVSSVERGEGGTRRRDLTEEEMVELLRAGGKFTKIDDDVIGAKRRETPPPPVVQRDSTGKDTVSIKNLKKRLQDLDPDEIKNLDNNLRRVVRQGMIEKGLFRKSLKFQSEQDVADALQFLVDKDVKSDWWRKTDTFRSLSRLALDPVTVEGWLLQISKSDENGFMYEVFFKNFKKPYEQTQRNNAETRRTIDRAAEKHLGIKSKLKFVRYLNKKLKNGMLRSEAMWAYALDRDAGRSEAVRKDGIRARDNRYDIDEAIGLLSSADKAFVDSTAKYFQNNDFIERAFRNHLLLNGYEAERSPDRWFTSRRNIEPSRLAKGIDDFAVQVITETDALKARTENVGVPFQLDGGYVAAFYHVSDRLSIFAEMGMNMHRAEKLINDPKFTEDFRRRYGNRQLQTIQLYLRNILGMVGHNPSAMDVAFTYFPQAWLASKISGNVTSAIRQTFSLMTALGDDILDTSAILRSIGEQSGFNRKVGRRMRANSGFAFMRLNTGRFAEHLMVLGEQKAGTTFAWAQDQAFFLQRIMDDFALRITYRAAEIMAKKRGLRGEVAEDFVREKFETALMRNQASNSPLYASGLELEAKRHPMWRGTLALQRELNRLYNVPRRHVVRAMQEPTPKNIKQAMLSIFWSGIANTSASVGLNAIRHSIAFGLPAWGASELFKKYLQDLAGRWYLIGDVTSAFLEYGGRGESYAAERLLPPGPATLVDGIQMGWGVLKIAELSGLDTTDPDRYIKSGPRVGQTKMQVQMERTFKKGLSFGSAIFGMPFAALWYQASGMYNWQRNDYRLMVHLEAEWAQLRKDEVEDTSTRGREIKRLRKAVNRIHSRRIKGFLTKEEARSMIIEKLELDQLVRTPVE